MPAAPITIARVAEAAERRSRLLVGLATKRSRILPSVLVIGAQRAGTTSLFHALAKHPHVARPLLKEIHFFDDQFWCGVDWYRAHFPLSASQDRARRREGDLVGVDATPYYLFHPAAPARAAATVPNAKLVVLLRDPVARAYSHFQKMRRTKVEQLPFAAALDAEDERLAGEAERLLADPRYRSFQHLHHSYVSRGLYADQLERWLAHFPPERLFVAFAEEFFARPQQVYAQVLAHLGLPAWEPPQFPNYNPGGHTGIDDETRAGLAARFAEPNERLRRLLGHELPWGQSSTPSSSPYARA